MIKVICSVGRKITPPSEAIYAQVAEETLSDLVHRPVGWIVEKLMDPATCADINAALRPQATVAKVQAPIALLVGSDGLPVSTNPVWNACIRGHVSLELIRSNTDMVAMNAREDMFRPKTCGDYTHATGLWEMPDHPGLTLSVSKHGPKNYSVGIPLPYVVVREEMEVGQK